MMQVDVLRSAAEDHPDHMPAKIRRPFRFPTYLKADTLTQAADLSSRPNTVYPLEGARYPRLRQAWRIPKRFKPTQKVRTRANPIEPSDKGRTPFWRIDRKTIRILSSA